MGDFPPPREPALQFRQLAQAQGGLKIGQSVVIAQIRHLVVPGTGRRALVVISAEPVVPKTPHQLGQRLVAGGDHSAFAGGDRLDRVEAEGGQVGQAAHRLAPLGGPQGMRSVVDQDEIVLSGDPPERPVVARLAGEVDRDDRPRPGGDPNLDLGRVQEQGLGVHVGEDGRSPLIDHAIGGGRKRDRRHDHLVPRPDPQSEHRRVQRRRPAADGHPVGRAHVPGHCPLKALHRRAGGQPLGPQHRGDQLDIVFGHRLTPVGKQGVAGGILFGLGLRQLSFSPAIRSSGAFPPPTAIGRWRRCCSGIRPGRAGPRPDRPRSGSPYTGDPAESRSGRRVPG